MDQRSEKQPGNGEASLGRIRGQYKVADQIAAVRAQGPKFTQSQQDQEGKL